MMKFLRKFLATVAALFALTMSAWAADFQKNDNRQQPPPDKKEKEIPKGEKPPPPPPPRNDNRGNEDKKGRP